MRRLETGPCAAYIETERATPFCGNSSTRTTANQSGGTGIKHDRAATEKCLHALSQGGRGRAGILPSLYRENNWNHDNEDGRAGREQRRDSRRGAAGEASSGRSAGSS